jgi:phage tail sheath protein FI
MRHMMAARRRDVSNDPVHRLVESLEASISDLIRWAAFEPNDEPTWARVRQVVGDYLMVQWREGTLVGSTPDKAFFVRCDRSTMTQDDIDTGRLICIVGVAPVKPAEFVILQITQMTCEGAA